jgi:hypothetical protein
MTLKLSQDVRVARYGMDNTVDDHMARIAIRHMYGIKIGPDDAFTGNRTLESFTFLCILAEDLEVAGLVDAVVEFAGQILEDCLDDKAKLQSVFLSDADSIYGSPELGPDCLPFVIKIFGEKLDKLRRKSAFRKLLKSHPKMATDLLDFVLDKQSEMEEDSELSD